MFSTLIRPFSQPQLLTIFQLGGQSLPNNWRSRTFGERLGGGGSMLHWFTRR